MTRKNDTADRGRRRALVRGIGDVGSAVAIALFRAGYRVVIHDDPMPATTRRGMAFTDALFDGTAVLDGVVARLVGSKELARMPGTTAEILATVGPFERILNALQPNILIDARMRKRAAPEVQRGLAPLTIGLGPGFVARKTTDLVIETVWGEALGKVIRRGAARPLGGGPRLIGGKGRERFVVAPESGAMRTDRAIGEIVDAGEIVATVGKVPLRAPLAGAIRGLTRDGVVVARFTRVIEIDPRGSGAVVTGIGERPQRIAEGVLRAIGEKTAGTGGSRSRRV